jgi:hypothetical protein
MACTTGKTEVYTFELRTGARLLELKLYAYAKRRVLLQHIFECFFGSCHILRRRARSFICRLVFNRVDGRVVFAVRTTFGGVRIESVNVV